MNKLKRVNAFDVMCANSQDDKKYCHKKHIDTNKPFTVLRQYATTFFVNNEWMRHVTSQLPLCVVLNVEQMGKQ